MLSVGARAIEATMVESTGASTDAYDSHWQSTNTTGNTNNALDTTIYCASIFREVICLILFNRRVAQMNVTMQTVLNLLTGEWKFQSSSTSSVASSNRGMKVTAASKGQQQVSSVKGNLHSSSVTHDIDDSVSVVGGIHRTSSQELNMIDQSDKVGGHNNHGITTNSTLFRTEQFLWGLLTCPDNMFMSAQVPSKDDISECLKYYRRLLTASQWKRIVSSQKSFLENFTGFKLSSSQHQNEGFEPDVNELFSIISILGIVCRAIILSYNVYLKSGSTVKPSTTSASHSSGMNNNHTLKHLKLGDLLMYLPPASKSDIANQLLESLEFSGNIWKHRFDPIWFQTNRVPYTSTLSAVALAQLLSQSHSHDHGHDNKKNGQSSLIASSPIDSSTTFKPSQLARFFKQHYLLVDTPIIPLVTFFKIISEKLPMPYPPEQTLTRMFPSAATTASST